MKNPPCVCPKLGSKRVLSDLLESQRRQLIEEQIVRRKPTERIHDWRIVRQQDDSVPDDPVPDDPSPPSPMTTVCLVLDQSVQTETPVEEVDHLRRRFEHNRRRLQVRFDQQMAAQRRRQQSQEHLQRLHQRFLRINSHRKTAILRGVHHHNSQHSASSPHPQPGQQRFVDTSSILENKKTTKYYWERKMLEQQPPLDKLSSQPSTATADHPTAESAAKLTSDGESDNSLSPIDFVDGSSTTSSSDSVLHSQCATFNGEPLVDSPTQFANQRSTSDKKQQVDVVEEEEEEEEFKDCVDQMPEMDSTIDHQAQPAASILLTTVVEEEPDSLEDFIATENQCNSLVAAQRRRRTANPCSKRAADLIVVASADNNAVDQPTVSSIHSQKCAHSTKDQPEKNQQMHHHFDHQTQHQQQQSTRSTVHHSDDSDMTVPGQEPKDDDLLSGVVKNAKIALVTRRTVSDPSTIRAQTESTIAREIRELREREEEIRRMRESVQSGQQPNDETKHSLPSSPQPNATTPASVTLDDSLEANKTPSNGYTTPSSVASVADDQCSAISLADSDEGFAEAFTNKSSQDKASKGGGAEIQKLLATTRIQQEIEEQTQRELALKAVGSIRTISVAERTDVNGALSGHVAHESNDGRSSSSKSDTFLTLHSAGKGLRPSSTVVRSPINKLAAGQSTAVVCAISGGLERRTASSGQINQMGQQDKPFKGLNGFKSCSPAILRSSRLLVPGVRTFAPTTSSYGSYTAFLNGRQTNNYDVDLRPPRLDPINLEKRYIQSADKVPHKIQTELREMQQREEELRKQRLAGISQPNLTQDSVVTDSSIDSHPNSQACRTDLLQRATSNPNLQLSSAKERKKRNPLIAQWEQKIQDSEQQ